MPSEPYVRGRTCDPRLSAQAAALTASHRIGGPPNNISRGGTVSNSMNGISRRRVLGMAGAVAGLRHVSLVRQYPC